MDPLREFARAPQLIWIGSASSRLAVESEVCAKCGRLIVSGAYVDIDSDGAGCAAFVEMSNRYEVRDGALQPHRCTSHG